MKHDEDFNPLLNDLPSPEEPRGFKPVEMVRCEACLRANPPTRANCMYCLAALPVAGGTIDLRKPTLRPLEEWEQGFNNVVIPGADELPAKAQSEIAGFLKLEPEVVKLILSRNEALPLARAATLEESTLIRDRLSALGVKTVIVSDADLAVENQLPKRIRALELKEDALLGREPLAESPISISWDAIHLIVAGRLLVTRVEVEENKFRGGERELIDSREFSDDEPVVDIYTGAPDGGWRVAARSFDFSCLGQQKKLMATENFVCLLAGLRARAPEAAFDDSYLKLRKLLTAVWPMVQQTQGGGWRRARPGKYNVAAVTTVNNENQFTRYSRLRHHLKLQGI